MTARMFGQNAVSWADRSALTCCCSEEFVPYGPLYVKSGIWVVAVGAVMMVLVKGMR